MSKYHLLLAAVLLPALLNGVPAPEEKTPTGGFEYQDTNQDGINDNLVKDIDKLTGQTPVESPQAPTDPKGGRQEARDRYRHGYHGQELERARNLHQHDQGPK